MGASASRRRDDIRATKDGPGRSSAASESRISRLGLPVNPRPPTSRASFASHGLTHIGGKRENQDEVLVDDRFMGDPDMKLYCVFDGHGQHGAAAARFARDFLPTQLAFELEKSAAASRAARLTADAARLDGDEHPPRMFGERQFDAIALASLVEVDPEVIPQSLVRAFTVTDAEMRIRTVGMRAQRHDRHRRARHTRRHVRRARGGFARHRRLRRPGRRSRAASPGTDGRFFKPRRARRDESANGDGRGEGGSTPPFQKRLEAEQLTIDHRPGDERARLETAGGRVTAPWGGTRGDAKVGPERLFLKDAQLPGILISRSLGDEVASSVGCFAVPEVTRREVRKGDRALILASDGVWDAVDNEEVALAMERAAAEMREASHSEESRERPEKIVAKTTRDAALAGWARRGGVADNVGVVAVLLDAE